MMTITAWVLGVLGGLCAVMGVLTAVDVIPVVTDAIPGFNALLWVALGAFLMLSCIATVLSRTDFE